MDRVVIHPPGDGGGPPGVELIGDLLAMLRAGGLGEAGDQDARATGVLAMFASSVKEGQGGYFLPGLASLRHLHRPGDLRPPPRQQQVHCQHRHHIGSGADEKDQR